jgi:hypothetical protein
MTLLPNAADLIENALVVDEEEVPDGLCRMALTHRP